MPVERDCARDNDYKASHHLLADVGEWRNPTVIFRSVGSVRGAIVVHLVEHFVDENLGPVPGRANLPKESRHLGGMQFPNMDAALGL
jgi:hypothetical protein